MRFICRNRIYYYNGHNGVHHSDILSHCSKENFHISNTNLQTNWSDSLSSWIYFRNTFILNIIAIHGEDVDTSSWNLSSWKTANLSCIANGHFTLIGSAHRPDPTLGQRLTPNYSETRSLGPDLSIAPASTSSFYAWNDRITHLDDFPHTRKPPAAIGNTLPIHGSRVMGL